MHVRAHPEDLAPNLSVNRGIQASILSRAIRGGAAFDTIAALTQASASIHHQLVHVRHYRQGTVLHEAIKYRASAKTILYFVNTIIKYEYAGVDADAVHHHHHHTTIFNHSDGAGRCPLHYLVERVAVPSGRDCRDDLLLRSVQLLAHAFPPAIGKRDTDGLTPLDLALTSTKHANGNGLNANNEIEMEMEMRLFRLCEILVKEYPMAAFPSVYPAKADICLAYTYENSSQLQMRKSRAVAASASPCSDTRRDYSFKNAGTSMISRIRNVLSPSVDGNIEHNPLSRALLYGRHISTIEILIEVSKMSQNPWYTGHLQEHEHDHKYEYEDNNENEKDCQQNNNSGRLDQCSMAIVTRDFEIALHIAVTMRASLDVIQCILSSAPQAAAIPDRCGLTPICWTWMRHVIGDDPIRASKRRLVPSEYVQNSSSYTSRLAADVARDTPIDKLRLKHEEREVWQKLSKLLPASAASLSSHRLNHEWNPLHAASFLDCPRAVVLLAVTGCPRSLKTTDSLGNLPLHYAAARRGYSRCLSIGATSSPYFVSEISPIFDMVPLYPECTQVANSNFQLPLHIAIEFETRVRRSPTSIVSFSDHATMNRKRRNEFKMDDDSLNSSAVLFLAKFSPETLQVRDGISGLYPFLQASIGEHSSLNTVYLLLSLCPSLV